MSEVKTKTKPDAPHYTGHRKRLRERFLKTAGKGNSSSIADYELLEIILFASKPRGDVKPLAKKLIQHFGDLGKVISAPVPELARIDGVGDSAIAAIKAVQEASFYLLKNEVKKVPILESWKSLLDYCNATMSHNKTEQFRVFFLDKKNKLIADELQQEGTVDHTPVYPREVIKRAIELGSSSIILAHNHPSGDPNPSKADIEMTKLIMQGAAGVGILIHDHIIIGKNRHYSFAANGLL